MSVFFCAYFIFTNDKIALGAASDPCSDSTGYLTGESTAQRQARLTESLALCTQEQEEAQNTLAQAQSQSASLQKDIAVLNAKIKVAQLNIQAKNLLIATLAKDITTKEAKISSLEERIEDGRQSLAQIMRRTQEIDDYTLPEILLSQKTLTGALADIDSFASIQQSLAATFAQIRGVKSQTESERNALDKKKDQETDAKLIIEKDKASVQKAQVDRQNLLAVSKNTEKTYAQILAEKQVKAAQIRAALFPLAGGGAPIPFADALSYANVAAKATGIRPAFLLAVFQQESGKDSDATFGKNVGSCYVTDFSTGNGIGANTGSPQIRVMNPTRDVPVFQRLATKLKFEPSSTRVSCWQAAYDSKGAPSGWGGAMGPAQFIPSTWVLFEDRVAAAVGKSVVNPWNPMDAFMAAATYLTDLGAYAVSPSGELNAACKYYSGSSCTKSARVKSYGTSVMSKANTIQTTMIDPLQGV
ncbi:MAG: hypothetical protein RIT04_612 [Candidatus Parcubacteria bacterium]